LDASVRSEVRARVFAQVGLSDWASDAALLISATSWTADEDFALLLEALRGYDASSASTKFNGTLPRLVVVITGTGPLKESHEERFRASPLSRVAIRTAWFEEEDYPKALAAADLGVCMHTSSSGLDLPMKIADMFGSHVPVIAFDYGSCLLELVEPGVNAVLFTSSTDLAERLEMVLRGFPHDAPLLTRLKDGAAMSSQLRWNGAWLREVRGTLLDE
jgi:beta-1,4-mannosyltransferase